MAAFQSLSLDEQKAIWWQIACDVSLNWDLGKIELSWLGYTNNAVFLLETDKARFVLRLHPPNRINISSLRSELEWLKVIRRNTNLIAPYPLSADVDGYDQAFITAYNEYLPSPNIVFCSLFDYVDGTDQSAADISPDEIFRVGEYLGKLHSAAQFTPPSDFVRPWLNWEGLFGTNSPYNPGDNAKIITAHQSEVFAEVAERVRDAMEDVGQGIDAFGLIHADMLCKNVLFLDGIPCALDFEYCGWGYYLYDLTPMLWQLKAERPDYNELEDAMWEGYDSIRPQAQRYRELLDIFIAGRQLASCRWLVSNLNHAMIRDIAPQLLEQRTQELKDFLQTGKLQRQSRTL